MRQRTSRTAEKVLLAALLEAHAPHLAALAPAGFVESTERLLLAAGRVGPRRLATLRRPGYRRFSLALERRLVPGQWLHLLLRKRFVEEEVEAAIAAGAEQLLVVGAGLDTLTLRLAPRHPRVRMVEIDHPATQAVRRKALATIGTPAGLGLLAADLSRTTLAEVLAEDGGWRRDAPTFVVAEGLLMYLAEPDVGRFLDGLGSIAGPGSRLLFSYVGRRADGSFDFGRVTRVATVLHRLTGEPFLWGVREGELEPFLAAHGLDLEGPPDRYDLRRRYLEPAGLGAGVPLSRIERLAIARRR
jgi:methyltransferase (TIGR00027 family)